MIFRNFLIMFIFRQPVDIRCGRFVSQPERVSASVFRCFAKQLLGQFLQCDQGTNLKPRRQRQVKVVHAGQHEVDDRKQTIVFGIVGSVVNSSLPMVFLCEDSH